MNNNNIDKMISFLAIYKYVLDSKCYNINI